MANVIRIGGGGAGGSTITLPPMVTNLKAVGSNATITVTFTNPVSDALAGVLVVYNPDHMPEKPSDGSKFDAGLTQQAVITGLTNGTQYYIRVFPYNEKKQYQTLIDGATTSATPNVGPAQVTNFQVTGSGASPVLTWINPADDPLYYQTVVVQKVGSAPTSITDGTEIYRGTGTTVTASNLVRLEEYYWAVFTVDEGGSYRTPVVSEMYSYDFPDEPTSYSDLITVASTKTWTAPEDGYFRFIVCGRGGDGGGYPNSNGSIYGGGGGGAGGIAVSVFALNKGETVSCICGIAQTQINYNGNVATANPGEDGEDGRITSQNPTGKGGAGGSASGGNVINKRGGRGENGLLWTANIDPPNYDTKGDGGTNSYDGKTIYGGRGEGHRNKYPNDISIRPTAGTTARIYIQRGNTNVAAPSAASTLSLTPRNTSIEANWENSQDPESVGTMVVVNSDHEPTTPEDGTSVDVAEATSYTVTDLPNNKPSYISLFAYNADKTKYSAARSDVEIPREVTWADTQDELEADVAEKTEELATKTEELEQKTEELNQTSEDLAENKIMVAHASSIFNALIISDIQNETKVVTDNMILDNADMLSKEWKVGVPNEVGDIIWYMIGDVKQYYKVIQPTKNADPNHTPNIVPAVFVAINKTNAGTIDDPIPAVRGMEYEYGKYYLDNEDGKIYICKRGEETGTIVLQYLPHELIGHYFELATLTE